MFLARTHGIAAFSFPGLTQAVGELRELVDVLTGVTAAWDAEAKVEVKALEQMFTKVVPLDHPEVV